jgi:hypothetical protein
MAKIEDMTVTLRAVDKVSPTLRRIGRRLWWMQYGGFVTTALVIAVFVFGWVAAFLLGRTFA